MTKKGNLILILVRFIVFLWDIITYPIYQAVYKPWIRLKQNARIRSTAIRSTDEEIVFQAGEQSNTLMKMMSQSKVETMADCWDWAVKRYGNAPLLGTREILDLQDEIQSNGKMFKKYVLGDYRWTSYEDANVLVDHLGRGLGSLGIRQNHKICIFAETRAEWMITAQACFKFAFPLVTLYTNLGEEAVVHGINQTKATCVVTSHELLPKFKEILHLTPTVTNVVYFEDQIKATNTREGYKPDVKIMAFYDVVHLGTKMEESGQMGCPKDAPRKQDTAIIMYTSGSTGVPKGVVLSHSNLFYTMTSILTSLNLETEGEDSYLAYLPLAHVLELLSESMLCVMGVRIGYSTPNTLTDKSSMIKKGHKGDASVLRPTIMGAVPLILDRVYKAISESVKRQGKTFEQLFYWAYGYKLNAIKMGLCTPILDWLMFRGIRQMLGGRMRIMFSGGAPLSIETQNFIQVCIGVPLLQGYGLTETTACATVSQTDELTASGTVGPPNPGMQIKLVNWEEGNYRVTDKPRPRGEILIGGPSVAEGYYEMPDKTKEDFLEEDGRRWFRSGDIGCMEANGTLRIIDRKKDLVKLQFGEYVSLGKVESVLKTCPVVDNICIYGDSTKSYCVALVVPERQALKRLAAKYGKNELSLEQMCRDRDVTGGVLRDLVNHSKEFKLEKFEVPGAVTIVCDTWDPDSGMVTAAMKLKRKPIQDFYQEHINRMYGANTSSSRG